MSEKQGLSSANKLEKEAQRLGVSKNALILFTLEKELDNGQKKK